MDVKAMKAVKGFTIVETMIGILLTGIASASILLGLTQAKLSLESIRIKEKAHQELKVYTENIKSMVASGVGSFGTDALGGQEVILKASSDGTPIIKGNLHKEIRKSTNSGDFSIYYYIHTYIVWQDEMLFYEKNNAVENLDTLEFKTYQVRFSL